KPIYPQRLEAILKYYLYAGKGSSSLTGQPAAPSDENGAAGTPPATISPAANYLRQLVSEQKAISSANIVTIT
ncbi:MAG: hypothetical protein SWZ49_21305, partial [Cyanobacteriota bacterium]|nr:hypothetical protein [Cyanobacteriota bacterium]